LSEHLGWVFLSYIVPEMILCSNRQQASIEEAKQLGKEHTCLMEKGFFHPYFSLILRQSPMGGIDCVPIFSLLLCVQITCPFSWITSYFISVI
jgi:hypothetical protein